MTLHDFDRRRAMARLADEQFDIVVVGGGITGAGVALDAASRGLRTALVERHDIASGTSSKSSKLVHGGLRYLQQREFSLVYQALAERQIALRNAPHLVRPLPFLLPMFGRDGMLNPKLARALGAAMWEYDLTGGARIGSLHRRLDRAATLAHMPALDTPRLLSSYLYHDARVDDARYTLAIARTAACDHGAAVVTRCAVSGVLGPGPTRGVTVDADGSTFDVRASVVVNATGVWAGELSSVRLRPAKGVHVVLPRTALDTDVAVVLPVPKDRRSVFVVPWGDQVYVGTTDTDHHGPLDDPVCTMADVEYLLSAVNHSIDGTLTARDVIGTWAGLRPLVAGDDGRSADLSRRHVIALSGNGVAHVVGGKLTTWRRMAADTVDAVLPYLGKQRRCRTARLPIRGGRGWDRICAAGAVDAEAAAHLAGRYGSEARVLLAMIDSAPHLIRPLVPGLPYLGAEAVFAARHEQAFTVDDVLSRRTRARLRDRDGSAAAAPRVAELMAGELGWDATRTSAEVASYRSQIAGERAALDRSPADPVDVA